MIRINYRVLSLCLCGVLIFAVIYSAQARDGKGRTKHFHAIITDITEGESVMFPEGPGFALDQAVVVDSVRGRQRGIFNEVVGHCTGDELLTNDAGGSITVGSCTYQDQDGDTILEEFTIERSTLYSEASGEGVLVSGTGKYEGITGRLTHTRRLLILNSGVEADFVLDGVFPGIGTLTGYYRLPRIRK